MSGRQAGDAYQEVLAYLSSFPGHDWVPGPLIRERCSATPASVNRALGQLVQSARVEKMPYYKDKRQNVYRLTRAPLRLIVGHDREPTASHPLMPGVPGRLLIDVMECGHTAIAHIVPEAKASPYVHDLEAKTVRRRCVECAPAQKREGVA